jgi:hypothetical protein
VEKEKRFLGFAVVFIESWSEGVYGGGAVVDELDVDVVDGIVILKLGDWAVLLVGRQMEKEENVL